VTTLLWTISQFLYPAHDFRMKSNRSSGLLMAGARYQLLGIAAFVRCNPLPVGMKSVVIPRCHPRPSCGGTYAKHSSDADVSNLDLRLKGG